jgi:hypothetical protein
MVKILERVEKPGVLWKDPEEESHECAVPDLRPGLVHQELLLSIMASPIGARIPKAYSAGFRLTKRSKGQCWQKSASVCTGSRF